MPDQDERPGQGNLSRATRPMSLLRWAGYALVLALALATYLHDLSSPHIPKNGDEYPYTHITRLTAASGAFLPLRSELPGMRNTKPPLLFWQGIVSTHWGRSFGLWNLRYPSVIYTMLTAALLFLLGRRLAGVETGFVAALAYLAFFTTYRYGRPFLTNGPEVFWLFIPFFALLYWRPASFRSRFAGPSAMGLALGVGLLYKSFALAAPIGLGLALWYAHHREFRFREFVTEDLAKIVATVVVALGVFATWFLLDPDPRAVFQEFVVGENAGKFDVAGAYLPGLFWGRFSIPSLGLGLLLNAGLLVVPVAMMTFASWRRRRELGEPERLLWLWVLALFIVFCLPSQRSSRYLLPAMPALALLLALQWPRLGRFATTSTLVLAGGLLATISFASFTLMGTLPGPEPYGIGHWALLLLGSGVVAIGLFRSPVDPPVVLGSVFLVLLAFSSLLGPLDGPLGRYDVAAVRAVEGRDVRVPVDFVGKEEGYRFLLPGARVHAYQAERNVPVADVLERYPLAVVRLRPGDTIGEDRRLIGERLDLRGRHSGEEMRAMLGGQVAEHLFVREVLVERTRGDGP